MFNTRYCWSIFLFLSIQLTAQINQSDISSIRITDEINMNYEHVTSLNFELRFNKESIEMWDTHQISRLEFERTIYSKLRDSLPQKKYITSDDISLDSLLTVLDRQIDHLNRVYQLYCDTIKSTFIKVIPPESIDKLVAAINAPLMDKEEFLTISGINDKNESHKKSILKELNYRDFTYYPLIGVTIHLKNRASIIFYCEAQGPLSTPWLFKATDQMNYNPEINWALYEILSEQCTLNRSRLSKNSHDLNKKFNQILVDK